MTKNEARELLSRQLNENRGPGREIVVSDGIDKDYGWVFYYQSKRHLDTGETRYALVGNGPVVIEHDGSMHRLGTGLPPEELIAQFERTRVRP